MEAKFDIIEESGEAGLSNIDEVKETSRTSESEVLSRVISPFNYRNPTY